MAAPKQGGLSDVLYPPPQAQLLYEAAITDVGTEGSYDSVAGPWTWPDVGVNLQPGLDFDADELARKTLWYPCYFVLSAFVEEPGASAKSLIFVEGLAGPSDMATLGSNGALLNYIDCEVAGWQIVSGNMAGQRKIRIIKASKIGASHAAVAQLRLMVFGVPVESLFPKMEARPSVA